MTPEQTIIETQILYGRLVDYWYRVDHHGGVGVSDMYMPDGVFRGSLKPLVGRAAIQQFYDWRLERGPRTARHVVTNFRAEFQDADHATSMCIMLLYAADGEPVLPSAAPILISDMIDAWVRDADGTWLVADRNFVSIFVDREAVTSSAMAKSMSTSPFADR